MKSLRLSLLIFALASCAAAQTYTYHSLYSFQPKKGLNEPTTSLVFTGGAGYGGMYNGIYSAKPSGVHLLGNTGLSSPMIADASGNLYGVEAQGNNNGVIFELLSPHYNRQILYAFKGAPNGQIPLTNTSPLLFDPSGDLWGTTFTGGPNECNLGGEPGGCGVVYELINNGGVWSEQVVYSFQGSPDGGGPNAPLTYDASTGVYYGTTEFGGDPVCDCGTVFQLAPDGNGGWMESVLYTFTGQTDGGGPLKGVTLDGQGNLYGTASVYGDPSCVCGTIYEISGGVFSVLHTFIRDGNGTDPNTPLTFDQNGNLWGTLNSGGNDNSGGIIFELTESAGVWNYSVFYSFKKREQPPYDGDSPVYGVTLFNGNLYGVTSGGGSANAGTIYEVAITP